MYTMPVALEEFPFVSICTPTFNRRPFIPYIIKCIEQQTYPKDRIEWVVIDDGTDPIGDLVKDLPYVKYFYYETKMELGKKRNLMHTKCSGDILVYMDDDDYYPPHRVSHSVESLQRNPTFLIAGTSEMHIYFNSCKKMYQCGPYGANHSTAAAFAFRKEILLQTHYDDNSFVAEEPVFLKNRTIPMVQMDPLLTICVFSHQHSSLNKDERMLKNPEKTRTVPSKYSVDDFIKDPVLKQFYMYDMDDLLSNYELGKIEHKPGLVENISKIESDRAARINQIQQAHELSNMKNVIADYERKLAEKHRLIIELLKTIKQLKSV